MAEQKRVVAVLYETEELKQKRQEADKKITDLISALFVKMFGNPLSDTQRWTTVPLSELGSLDRGKSQHRPRTASELFEGPYPFVQTGDITNAGWILNAYTQTYSEKGFAQSKLWPKGTLCITIAANIARTTILGFDACFPDSVVGFIANERSNADYVQGLFLFLQRKLEAMAPRAAQLNINLEILRGLEVPLPPIELQNEFARAVADIQRLRLQQEQSGIQIERISSALSARLFALASH
jgi:type I restriction enzyme S subunit